MSTLLRPQCRKAHALGVQTGTVIRPSAIESPCPLAGRGALTPLHKGDGFPRQCEHWLEMTQAGRCGHRPIRNGTSRTPSPTKCRGCVHAPYNGTSGTPSPTNDSFFDSLKAHPGGCASVCQKSLSLRASPKTGAAIRLQNA